MGKLPTQAIEGLLTAIERLIIYLYYHYDNLKRNQIFIKVEK